MDSATAATTERRTHAERAAAVLVIAERPSANRRRAPCPRAARLLTPETGHGVHTPRAPARGGVHSENDAVQRKCRRSSEGRLVGVVDTSAALRTGSGAEETVAVSECRAWNGRGGE
jgi:hypothetical protein